MFSNILDKQISRGYLQFCVTDLFHLRIKLPLQKEMKSRLLFRFEICIISFHFHSSIIIYHVGKERTGIDHGVSKLTSTRVRMDLINIDTLYKLIKGGELCMDFKHFLYLLKLNYFISTPLCSYSQWRTYFIKSDASTRGWSGYRRQIIVTPKKI